MQNRILAAVAERSHDASGLTISTTRHDGGLALPAHLHPRAYFCFVMRGRFFEESADRHECGAGTLVYHPAGDVHRDEFVADTRCLNVELPPAWAPAAGKLARSFGVREQRSDMALTAIARRLHAEFLRGDPASDLAMQGLALELAAEWTRFEVPAGRRPPWLDEAVRIIRAEFRGRIDLGELAARVGVHAVHLSRTFRRQLGVTMTEFIIRTRVEFAARLLSQTALPIGVIAAAAGFADQSHLGRVFRRTMGTSCRAYRSTC